MRWGWLVVLCACNQILDLHETSGPGGPDAAYACRTDRPLRFAATLQQLPSPDCAEYSEAATADAAVATCQGAAGVTEIWTGTRDGALMPLRGITTSFRYQPNYTPRLASDATRLYVRIDTVDINFMPIATRYDEYRNGGTGWTLVGTLGLANQLDDWLSNIARDPTDRDRVVLLRANTLQEWSYDGATWTPDHMYAAGAISPPTLRSVMFAANGLHILVIAVGADGVPQVLWGKRDSVSEPFGTLAEVPDLPVPDDNTVFMSNDCGRAYFSGLGATFYTHQL